MAELAHAWWERSSFKFVQQILATIVRHENKYTMKSREMKWSGDPASLQISLIIPHCSAENIILLSLCTCTRRRTHCATSKGL